MQNPAKILIVDDFFHDLDWLLPYLEGLTAYRDEKVNYAQLVFPTPLQAVRDAIRILSERVDPVFGRSGFQASLRVSTIHQKDQHRGFVHFDPSLNVIIYLSGKEGEEGGTHFYRHERLGLESMTANDPSLAKANLLVAHDTNDLSRWTVTKRIPFRKNRAVIFPGALFHSSPPDYYGNTLSEGRITMNFFFGGLRNHQLP